MGASLLYLLVFSTMSLSVASETLDVTETGDTSDERNTTVQWNAYRYCPDGWTTYSGPDESSCLFPRTTHNNFYDSKSYCEVLGGALVHAATRHKYNFIRNFAKAQPEHGQNRWYSNNRNYWIGLYKGAAPEAQFHWLSIHGVMNAPKGSLPENIETRRNTFSEMCISLSNPEYLMISDSCSDNMYSICEKDMTICEPGTFGQGCEQTCHCQDEPCSLQSFDGEEVMICKNGCQRGWTGMSCDIEKPVPEVQYYCINETETQKAYAYIQIFTKGVQYRDVYSVNSSKVRVNWCPSTVVNTSRSDLTTITIPIDNVTIEQMSRAECAGQQLDEKTFTWQIVIKEKVDILLENDLKMTISCNFGVADSLLSSDKYSIQREEFRLTEKTFNPISVHDDVQLAVVRAYTRESVTEAAVGSVVYLEMRYALKKGSHLTGVSPHSCEAFSPDRKHVIQLLTERGCAATHSPVEAFKRGEENKIVTPWFYLFALDDSPTVTFQCSFHLCFTSDCHVGCAQPKRNKRDTERDEESHSITRTVRVLPSIHAKQATGDRQVEEHQQPAGPPASPPGYNMGPAIYLNPVTCSLFLIILLVFLCMYIAFIRTLRKSVYDIRREIEVRRSRDKFLHCGCVQQKDRDTVATRT
ncbi:hypothetical protein BsWGS_02528 [Bradybaena similaris]